MPASIRELADQFLTDPATVSVKPAATTAERVDQQVTFVNQAEKQALLLGEPGLFFTTPGYDGLPLVMVRLAEVSVDRLTELVTDAWRMRAPQELGGDRPDTGAVPG